jgi:hypothetical protein
MAAELTLIKGCDYTLPLTLDVKVNGVFVRYVDLTGATVKFQATKSPNDPESRAMFTIEQTTHVDPTLGQTTIVIPKEQLTEVGVFVYRLWFVDADGKVSKTIFGKLKLEY